jgi:hypothetical protein
VSDAAYPQPDDTPEEVAKKLDNLAAHGAGGWNKEWAEWLNVNAQSLDAVTFEKAYDTFQRYGLNVPQVAQQRATNLANVEGGPFGSSRVTLEELAAQRATAAVAGDRTVTADLDNNGTIDSSEKALYKKAFNAAVSAQSKATGQDRKTVEADAGDALNVVPWPDWLRGMAGGTITPEQMSAMLEHWNELHPNDRVETETELMQRMAAQTLDANIVAQDVILGTDPDFNYVVRLADGSTTTVQRSQFETLRAMTGGDFDAAEVNRLVRLADEVGLSRGMGTGPDGQPQKAVDFAPAVLLANALGVTNLAIDKTAKKNAVGRDQQGPDAGLPTGRQEQYVSDIYKLRNALVAYQFNYATYGGNVGLAYLGVMDSALASRVASTPWDSLSLEDRRQANELFVQGGVVQGDNTTEWGAAGVVSGEQLVDLATPQNTGGGGGGGGGYSRTLPDPVAVKQAARDMYQSLFIAEPDEAQLQQFVAIVNSQISSAPSNQSVDASARLRDILEGNALYKEFYGKAGGLSDGEYQQQFRSGAQSMLGAEAADPNAVLGGMRTGNYQTTIGQVAGSQKAWGNSTFLGRLAQAASVVNENT